MPNDVYGILNNWTTNPEFLNVDQTPRMRLVNTTPSPFATGVATTQTIIFELEGTFEPLQATLNVQINGEAAITNGVFTPLDFAQGDSKIECDAGGIKVTIDPRKALPESSFTVVAIQVTDLAGNTFELFLTFFTQKAAVCFRGPISETEQVLLNPITRFPAIERGRRRLLDTVAASTQPEIRARAITQIAGSIEHSRLLNNVFVFTDDILDANVCEKRKLLEIDTTLAPFRRIYTEGLSELRRAGMADSLVDVLDSALSSRSFNYRVAAMSLIVLTGAILAGT